MKQTQRLPIPQKEFGFTPDTFNLFSECADDGERIAREREQLEKTRERLDTNQRPLFQTEK